MYQITSIFIAISLWTCQHLGVYYIHSGDARYNTDILLNFFKSSDAYAAYA
jgi:hypothetical protein